MANKVEWEIVKKIEVLSISKSGWKKELNLVSWNGKEPKFDIREWNEDHTKMSKGITFTIEEAKVIVESLRKKEGV